MGQVGAGVPMAGARHGRRRSWPELTSCGRGKGKEEVATSGGNGRRAHEEEECEEGGVEEVCVSCAKHTCVSRVHYSHVLCMTVRSTVWTVSSPFLYNHLIETAVWAPSNKIYPAPVLIIQGV